MTDPDFTAIFNQVHGFLSLAEAELLYRLASEVPANGVIVEIGSYQGRSTVCLGLGAKEAGALVYAIDPHNTYEVDGVQFGMSDNQAYYENIAKYQVGDVVRTVNMPVSTVLRLAIAMKMDLVFIDGKHDYEDVKADFKQWAHWTDKMAFHDTAGFHPGVTQLVNEVLAAGQWEITQQCDAISVLERVK